MDAPMAVLRPDRSLFPLLLLEGGGAFFAERPKSASQAARPNNRRAQRGDTLSRNGS